ncbi:phosphate acetyltransferase [Moraxella macacae 0408225]|uniref:Phosphate acetyltransferase n=1 Tax=Moraxella macacae 0408225 TaxID=1230338 RepID=L2F6Y0_9GAMM|nr:phosphate acetyltransferase [Moraxella macacae 0408225]
MTTILFIPVSQTADLDGAIAKTGKAAFSPFESIGQNEFESALANGKFDDLLETVYEKAQAINHDNPIQIVKGIALTHGYASSVNEKLAHALDADVILVGDEHDDALFAIAKQVFGERVIGQVKTNDDVANLIKANNRPSRLSPSAFRSALVKKAQSAKKRIVLPEGAEVRTVEAAIICQNRGIANCVMLATKDEVQAVANSKGLTIPDDLEIIDPASIAEQYVAPMVERRKGKIDEAKAREELKDTVVLGTMMLHMGDVDGLVSGAVHTTANTIRPAFQLIKTAPHYSLVSSIFFMLLPEQVVVYGDCAVNPNPTAEQLAEIAIQSAQSAKAFGIDPKVAMISYSTMNSASGPDVDLVTEATQLVKQKMPELAVDGPLQYDAAVVANVAKSKAPNSPVAGQANVFIFPNLSVGNALYKAVQRNANVLSVGPMLQGLNKPVNDLSRGCLMDDIIYTIALTAVQAMSDDG